MTDNEKEKIASFSERKALDMMADIMLKQVQLEYLAEFNMLNLYIKKY